jgi:hypothetical protein
MTAELSPDRCLLWTWPHSAPLAGGRLVVKRAYKLRAYPTRPQEGRAVRLLADHCDL